MDMNGCHDLEWFMFYNDIVYWCAYAYFSAGGNCGKLWNVMLLWSACIGLMLLRDVAYSIIEMSWNC